ncbi:hypothetical protein JHK86_004352 [Glycine max]|nr:hypothetical protein JHK86_004352 [Glycine max]
MDFFFFVEEVAAIVAVIKRLSWCIEEASTKSNTVVHHRGSFVTVHRRGKHHDPVLFPPLLPAIA